MLTKSEKSTAEMFALGCIAIEDVEYLLKCDVCDLTKEWHDYVKSYGEKYDKYLRRQNYALECMSSFDTFIKSGYGLHILTKIHGCTVYAAIDGIHDVFDNVIECGMQIEIARDLANGITFFDACRDWDVI